MAAYAATISLLNLLEHIESYHGRYPIFLDSQQTQLESLKAKVTFLENYLQHFHIGGTKDGEHLERLIANASYEAEDIIESHIVDDILSQSSVNGKPVGFVKHFSQNLHKAIVKMDSVRREAREIRKRSTLDQDRRHLLPNPVSSSSRSPPAREETMVGHGESFITVMDKVMGDQPERQIIPVTGIGGIGKTKLAMSVYEALSTGKHFDVCGWITVSQQYHIREVLLSLLRVTHAPLKDEIKLKDEELGLILHKHLYQRRYLIVLDDMWSIKAWEGIRLYLPDNSNQSRVLVTSRLQDLANGLDSSNHVKMNLLGMNESWSLLCKVLFGEKTCPVEFEEIGKRIASNCKGLPLSIIVIGGLLAKSKMILQEWEHISKNISKIVNSMDDDNCLAILSLSYNHLPMYLKPCFLYMAVFPEDLEISVSELIKMWVGEGFLRPIANRTLEEVAEDYLKNLVDRNLIFVSRFGSTGKVKGCRIHDLLRDLCSREARKCGFLGAAEHLPDEATSNQRRSDVYAVWFSGCTIYSPKSAPFLRSFVVNGERAPGNWGVSHRDGWYDWEPEVSLARCKLLRVLHAPQFIPAGRVMLPLVNSRYINILYPSLDRYNPFPSFGCFDPVISVGLYWNLETLILDSREEEAYTVPAIWEMPKLQHLKIKRHLWFSDPPSGEDCKDIVVLESLQTLKVVKNFRCTEEVLKRMPNVKKLKIHVAVNAATPLSHYSLRNLDRLHKLQSLWCNFDRYDCSEATANFPPDITFPQSLRKLTLMCFPVKWNDISTSIGKLPHLEYLNLGSSCYGEEWNPVEGQFINLKVLILNYSHLLYWNADSGHFPCLECIYLYDLDKLEEIPPGIGELDTLRLISVDRCCRSLYSSATEILYEKQNLGDEDFYLQLDGRAYQAATADGMESSEAESNINEMESSKADSNMNEMESSKADSNMNDSVPECQLYQDTTVDEDAECEREIRFGEFVCKLPVQRR